VFLAAPAPAAAQYAAFGKNKVQYENFDWLTLKGEHVEVFYYPQEEPIARLALIIAEESYTDLAAKFQHEVPRMIPVIVYSSHHHFEQTNVSPFFVPEGVQGFTEFMKGRVVLPYTGSYAEFQHVLHHEMVHVFQFSILDENYKHHRRATYMVPPLWFSEGLAEYWSTGWDAQGTMVLSDMVLEGKLPAINNLWQYNGTFTVYKLGQSLCQFIGETYGQDALRRLYTEGYKDDTFEKAIQRATGVPVRRVSDEWILAMKRRYYPEVKDRSSISTAAQDRAVSQGINLKPVAAPDSSILGGDRYFFISARSGYTNIYSATYKGAERNVKSVVRGQRGSQFESFHPFQSRIDVSRAGELVFISKWDGKDALFVFDPKKGEVVLRRRVEDLISLASPAWSRDGSKIAFTGLRPSGQSDLYVMERDTGKITRLTNDYYADYDPTWSPDDKEIAFASDRTRYGKDGHHNLFLINLETLEIRYLTYGPWTDQTPSWSPDGSRIAFASDRSGMFEIYTVDREGNGSRAARLLGATLDPSWLPDGKSFLFTGFSRGGFGIYQMPVRAPAAGDSFSLDLALAQGPAPWNWEETLAQSKAAPETYKPHYGLDLIQGGLSVAPTDNVVEGFQGAFSDLLGNRLYYFQVGNSASQASEILSRMNVGVWNINRQHRWNYGVGVFHTAGDFQDVAGVDYFERKAGGSVIASYPFSRFRRIDGTMSIFYDDKETFFGFERKGMLATHSISLVSDNTLWFPTGPRDGSRLNLTGAITTNLSSGRNENMTVLADIRRYFRVSQWTSLAMRVQGRASTGADPQRFVMGGSLSMRGYPREFFEGTRLFLANVEYRFPVFDNVVLGVPFRGLGLPSIEGAAFADAGTTWEKFEPMPKPVGSFGFGLRMNLAGYMVLRYDFAKLTDFERVRPGWEHEFYLGFDY
jgi:hypothetical protein